MNGTPTIHPAGRALSRRRFLALAASGGVGLLAAGALSACNDAPLDPAAEVVIDLGSDEGVLNGLYALSQLKGEFANRVVLAPFVGMPAAGVALFTDLREHTTAHVGWFVERLRSRRIYDSLRFDFAAVDMTSAGVVLPRARQLADAVSAAYVDALVRLRDADTARVVAKMASVHARHAAAVRDLGDAAGTAFAAAEAVDPQTGLERELSLADALEALRPLFHSRLDVRS